MPAEVAGLDGSVVGGASRSESVRNALAAAPAAEDVVLVHDAARPLLTAALVEACVAGLDGFDAVVAAAPVTDTIKHAPHRTWWWIARSIAPRCGRCRRRRCSAARGCSGRWIRTRPRWPRRPTTPAWSRRSAAAWGSCPRRART